MCRYKQAHPCKGGKTEILIIKLQQNMQTHRKKMSTPPPTPIPMATSITAKWFMTHIRLLP